MAATQKKVVKTPKAAKAPWEKELDQYIHLLIVGVLKTCSDEENPVSAQFIAKELEDRFQIGMNAVSDAVVKRLSQKLDSLCDLGAAYAKPNNRWPGGSEHELYRGLGGRVLRSDKTEGKKTLYYFEPILTEYDVAYINSALESTHFLSEEEKKYLIARESAACGYWKHPKRPGRNTNRFTYFRGLWNILKKKLPEQPGAMRKGAVLKKSDSNGKLPTEDSSMLRKIMILRKAIKMNRQVDVVYGEYQAGSRKHLEFREKHPGKVNHLNPYAIVSQRGMAYVIVTHNGHDNPTHYRIDRIMELQISGNVRDGVPQALIPFFENTGGKLGSFLAEKYVSQYPLMMYAGDKRYDYCEFLCKASAVSVAVDCFGTKGIAIEPFSDEEVKIGVRASYDNIKTFCVQNCSLITPVSPPELVKQVQSELEGAVKKIRANQRKKK